jgi:2-polyprenyl-6-methoxyphenol hydroxylase-like FAD-dependent oxidoreductase
VRFAIVGGGPAGLFFAYLLKKNAPDHEVVVFEQNTPDATYGFGVVFSNVAMAFLQETDPTFYARFVADHQGCDYLEVVHQDVRVQLHNNHFSRTSRIDLLAVLQDSCREVGVALRFGVRIPTAADLGDYDVVVAADGVNSALRTELARHLRPKITMRRNLFAWYGTGQLFHPVSLVFRDTPHGVFIAHAYQYSAQYSTFLVETSPEAYDSAGLEQMSDEESRAFCETIFARELGANRLQSNKSSWFRAKVVETERWTHGNVVLLGDALRTVHFSLGSGTRMAMQDAIALYEAFRAADDGVDAAFARFEASRKGASDQFQQAASLSLDWYETVQDKMSLPPATFAQDYMKRTGRITDDHLRQRSPDFMAAVDRERSGSPPSTRRLVTS